MSMVSVRQALPGLLLAMTGLFASPQVWAQSPTVTVDPATGRGVIVVGNDLRYEGPIVNSKAHGAGVMTWSSGQRYEGNFVANKISGKGVMTLVSGERVEGDFLEGKPSGKGVWTLPTGERYEGTSSPALFLARGLTPGQMGSATKGIS